ncbi:MAG: cysteine methyltransferase [Chloroflexi bacterium]|nr:MAG: cysteine methyltransferase [Chloroflexota bacterium]TMF34906.1 MAG: cysteine methyltransferase [Chloroflexota bacterium]
MNDRAGGSRRAPEQNSAGVDPRAARIVVRIRAIPEGFVRTYGDIDRHAPRLVGRVLATVDEDLPWHRVVRADGSLSQGRRQRALLAREGVPMRGDRVDMHLARLPAHL